MASAALLAVACGNGQTPESAAPAPATNEAAVEPLAEASSADDVAAPVAAPVVEPPPADAAEQAPESDESDESVEPAAPDEGLVQPQPYDNAHALSVLRMLSVDIGPRVQGTAGERAAADFLAEQFASFGYIVREQRFPVQTFTVERLLVTANGAPIEAAAFTLSIGGSVTGRLVAVPGLGAAEDFSALDVGGAIALIERGELFFQEKVENAAAHGAAGVIISNNEPGLFQGNLETGSTVPAVAISLVDGLTLREALAAGEVVASIDLEGGLSLAESQNVIAVPPDGHCGIFVGGHYDTVPDVPGANDNASGTALVIELARAFAGSSGGEQVCFVGFGAEEALLSNGGILGSAMLVEDLEASGEVEAVSAMLNLDVAGDGRSLLLVGTPALVRLADAIADTLEIRAGVGSLPAGSGSDHLHFREAGIPVIFPTLVGSAIHVPGDNFGAISPESLAQVGRLAYAMLECLIQRAGGPLPAAAVCDT